MLLKVNQASVAERVAALNARYRHHSATAVLGTCAEGPGTGASGPLVSSFGAESVVLLHLVSVIAPETPVIFVDTRMLFQRDAGLSARAGRKVAALRHPHHTRPQDPHRF